MSSNTINRRATVIEALVAAADAVFDAPVYCPTCDTRTGSRPVIHSLSGGFGADWDYAHVVATIAAAKQLQWDPAVLGHDLNIITADDREVRFAIPAPPT